MVSEQAAGRGQATRFSIYLFAGLVGVSAGTAMVYQIHGEDGYFRFPTELAEKVPEPPGVIPPELLAEIDAAKLEMEFKNTALVLMLFTSAFTACLALTAGGWRGSATAAIGSFIFGSIFGASGGVAAAFVEIAVQEQLAEYARLDNTLQAIGYHSAAWVVVGVTVGTAVSLGTRWAGNPSMILSFIGHSVAAGVIAGALYAPLAAVLFPNDNPELAVPSGWGNRFFWLALSGGLMSVAIGRTRQNAAVATDLEQDTPPGSTAKSPQGESSRGVSGAASANSSNKTS